MAFDRKQQVRKFLKASVGAPIVDLCDAELGAVDEAVEIASIDYWIHFPAIIKDSHTITLNCGELLIDLDTEKNKLITNAELADSAYFVGLTRYDMTNFYPNAGAGNYFDSKLLGQSGRNVDSFLTEDPRYESDRINEYASYEDQHTGELDFHHDYINNKIIVMTPPMQGQVTFWYGWGFCPDKTINLIPMNHFSIFRRMVALQFIEIILASRTAITLSGDFEINTSDLEAKRDRLQEQLDVEIPEATVFVAQWG